MQNSQAYPYQQTPTGNSAAQNQPNPNFDAQDPAQNMPTPATAPMLAQAPAQAASVAPMQPAPVQATAEPEAPAEPVAPAEPATEPAPTTPVQQVAPQSTPLTPQQVLAMAGRANASMPASRPMPVLNVPQPGAQTVPGQAPNLPQPAMPVQPQQQAINNRPAGGGERVIAPIHDPRSDARRDAFRSQFDALLNSPSAQAISPQMPMGNMPQAQAYPMPGQGYPQGSMPAQQMPTQMQQQAMPGAMPNAMPGAMPAAAPAPAPGSMPGMPPFMPNAGQAPMPNQAPAQPAMPGNIMGAVSVPDGAMGAVDMSSQMAAPNINSAEMPNTTTMQNPAQAQMPAASLELPRCRPNADPNKPASVRAFELAQEVSAKTADADLVIDQATAQEILNQIMCNPDATVADYASLPPPEEDDGVKVIRAGYETALESDLSEEVGDSQADDGSMAARMAAELADDKITENAKKLAERRKADAEAARKTAESNLPPDFLEEVPDGDDSPNTN